MQKAALGLVENTDSHSMCRKDGTWLASPKFAPRQKQGLESEFFAWPLESLVKVNSANFTEIAVWLTKSKVQSLAPESQAQNASTPRSRSGRNVYFCPEQLQHRGCEFCFGHTAESPSAPGSRLSCCQSFTPRPNPSLKRTRQRQRHLGPGWRYAVHFHQPGPGRPAVGAPA